MAASFQSKQMVAIVKGRGLYKMMEAAFNLNGASTSELLEDLAKQLDEYGPNASITSIKFLSRERRSGLA